GAGHGRRTGGGAAAGGEREEKDGNYEVALRDQDQSSHLTLADLAIESAEVPEDIMVETRQIRIRDGDVLVLVGTMKGAFLFRSDARRSRWEMGGPFFAGQPVYALAYDGRAGRRRLWAAPTSTHWGPQLRWSDDFGRTWGGEGAGPRFPEDTGAALARIWQVRPGPADQSDILYCGVEPAALFVSKDAGKSWALNRGLYDHPHRPKWSPGGGGLCLHTV